MVRAIIAFMFVIAANFAQAQVTLTGTIGEWTIEMELQRGDDRWINGRYRYAGQDDWLVLVGQSKGPSHVKLTETFKDVLSGELYLEMTDTAVTGFWTNHETEYPVSLMAQAPVGPLFPKGIVAETDDSLTGQYDVGGYWINDWFAPNYEIGFNGGTVDVLRLGLEQLFVQFTFVVGPTYHFASFSNVATRTAPGVFEFNQVLDGGDKPCHLIFTFADQTLAINDTNSSWSCQFGARAHASFELTKSSDIAEFKEW